MLRRFTAAVAALAAASALAACEEHEVTRAESEGVYVTVGDLKYQVQLSRILNPANAEDAAYVKGVPEDSPSELEEDEEWFGVFVRVENETDETHRTASTLYIEDTTGAEFRPVPLDQQMTPLAYVPDDVLPKEEFPPVGSIPQTSTTGGALLLFQIPRQALENRPLELHIAKPGAEPAQATVALDV